MVSVYVCKEKFLRVLWIGVQGQNTGPLPIETAQCCPNRTPPIRNPSRLAEYDSQGLTKTKPYRIGTPPDWQNMNTPD